MTFEHGYHHERSLLELDARTRFLLGLCFCRHCSAAAEDRDIDAARLRSWAADEIRRVLDSGDALSPEGVDRDWAWRACNGELGRFLDVRIDSVTRLAASVHEAAMRAGVEDVAVIDPSGAMLGYATGHPESSERAVDIGWRQGIAMDRLGPVIDVAATGYFAVPGRLRSEVDGYLEMLPSDSNFQIILRPMPPDTRSADELAAKLEVVASRGVEIISFYHYGLMRLESIDWIRRLTGGPD